ncbi:peptidase U32 family protein [Butyrivibrio sp. NC2002]|uniref:peptidase U32 family protein n=1 Tax=Butyrivibrio sp. NC2002 TaxID=1410610 RepID=UPI00056CB9C4|nr:U32 family peptidase [Butyrivibrio sp. NC2002]
MQKVELLAPAGNYETMLGAFYAGADAVYLGGQGFGARAFADNFTQEELISAIRYAHIHGKKIYLTVNTLLKEKEVFSFREFFAPYAYAGLDAAIVQDLGIFKIIHEEFPWVELHASTQMTVTGPESARLLMDNGASRVVPARELSLSEIRKIHDYCLEKGSGIEIEAFVHGAMCYSYSGACLFSSMVGGRSGNRGKCAQPCRLPYKSASCDECYPLSLKDMCLVDRISELIEAGIDSFKIEGRMKKPEYAAGVTSVYRKLIDKYYDELSKKGFAEPDRDTGIKITSSKEDKAILSHLYLRSEIGEGYYYRHNGKEMVTLGNPAYNGSDDNVTANIREKYLDKKLKMPVNLVCSLCAKEKASLTLSTTIFGEKVSVTAVGSEVQLAQKRPMSEADCEKQLRKFGDSDFYIEEFNLNIQGDNIFIPVKQLNELRRDAISLLEEAILEKRGYIQHIDEPQSENEDDHKGFLPSDPDFSKKMYVSVLNADQLKKVCERALANSCISRIYVDSRIILLGEDIPEHGESDIFIALPYVCRAEQSISYYEDIDKAIEYINKGIAKGVLVRNLEQLSYILSIGYKGRIVADYGLYVWNHHALSMYETLAFNEMEFNLPLELNLHEQEDILKNCDFVNALGSIKDESLFAYQIYGKVPMMISANCVRNTLKECSGLRGSITDYSKVSLIDRTGRTMPVVYDCRYCNNVIYNSASTSLFKKMDKIDRTLGKYGVAYRLDFTTENGDETLEILKAYEGLVFDGEMKNSQFLSEMDYTAGHFEKSAT